MNIRILEECKAFGIVEKTGHVLFPDVIEQDSGLPLFYKPCVSHGAKRVIVDVELILVVDGVEIVEKEVFYFILPDDAIGRIGDFFIIIVDIYVYRLLIGIAKAECVKS